VRWLGKSSGPDSYRDAFSRPFWYFLWQCQKVHKEINVFVNASCFNVSNHSLVTFFACPKKVTKEKAGRFNADHSLRLTLKLMNRPEQQSECVRVQVQHSAACHAKQREALVFSLDHSINRMIEVNEKKALNQSVKFML
jgi:hypothetical protein